MRRHRAAGPMIQRSAFAGFQFPPEVISVAVRWYLRYGLSYRDVEELLAERGIDVDHVTVFRWVQRFTPLFADAARPCRHAPGVRWFVDETYVKIGGRWCYLYRAVDQFGQVIDVLASDKRDTAAARRFFIRALRQAPPPAEVSTDRAPAGGRWCYLYRAVDQFGQVIDVLATDKRDAAAARRFFTRALRRVPRPVEVTTDKAPAYLGVLEELLPAARHVTERYANNRVEADHGRLKARLRPMRGLKRLATAAVIAAGHDLVQNIRRGHYELGLDVAPALRLMAAFTELAVAI